MDTVVTIPCGISSCLITSRSPVENIGAFYFSGLSRSIRTDAHRATMNTNGPSKLARFTLPGMTPVLVPLRPSSEHILIVRAPGARDHHGCHSTPFIVGALRARRAPCLYFPLQACSFHSPGKDTHVGLRAAVERGPSQGARSGSTGPTWVSFPPSLSLRYMVR